MSGVDFDYARNRRDARLRAKLLMVLHAARDTSPTGYVSGVFLRDTVNRTAHGDQRFESDRHALGLLRDLVNLGLAVERPAGERRRGQEFGLEWVEYEIAADGILQHLQQRPPHPLIDDPRQLDA